MMIFYVIIFILIFSFAYAASSGAPWVPTWKKDFERIKRLAELKPDETFMELGCGNGCVCRAIASRSIPPAKEGSGEVCDEISVIGVELSLLQVLIAFIQTKLSGLKNVHIKFGNAFNTDVSNVDVLYMFLMPETYEKIRSKLETELKLGARVITYVWPIPGWEPVKVDEVDGSQKIYVYVMKKKLSS